MCMSIYYLYKIDDYKFEYLIAVLISLILFTLTNSFLFIKRNTGLAVYVGIKITVLIFIVMHVVELQHLVSILLFLWSVACIITGLKLEQKYLRIFALILALLSSAKLILFDITYSNLLTRACSLLICAALCFFISWVYHRVEKSNNEVATIPTENSDSN